MTTDQLRELKLSQDNLLTKLHDLSAADSYAQFLDDLSPVAWHVGHCAFVGEYWIREVIGGDNTVTEPLKNLYFPELSPKLSRARRMPPYATLLDFATDLFRQHLDQLNELIETNNPHPLLKDSYLTNFLLQHNHQHQETIIQALYQRALRVTWEYQSHNHLVACTYSAPITEISACESQFGNNSIAEAYDNERPVIRRALAAFKIGQRSVNNAEYLGFMESDGYKNKALWGSDGWAWLKKQNVESPSHWRRDDGGEWVAITHNGAEELRSSDAVFGLNRYEAEAFANYANGRLPHEFEWEHAAKLHTSPAEQAWDWCGNTFFPYPDYTAYPYDGYSQPWFDGSHYTLRGASRYTGTPIRRISFRNFYTPEKRHVFGGVRVAFDS